MKLNTFYLGNTYLHCIPCGIDGVAGKFEISKHGCGKKTLSIG